jgi:RNA polymerase sigma-70 factor (ECF subfamily)
MSLQVSNNLDFEEILKSYNSLIHKVCYMFKSDPDSRRDLYQEICINIWRGLPAFKGKSSLSTWLYRVALNTALSDTRKLRHNPLDRADEYNEQLTTSFQTNHDQYHDLSLLLNTLNASDKAIILLHLEDKSYSDIAEIIGISANNVSVKLVRIKKHLEAEYQALTGAGGHHE